MSDVALSTWMAGSLRPLQNVWMTVCLLSGVGPNLIFLAASMIFAAALLQLLLHCEAMDAICMREASLDTC